MVQAGMTEWIIMLDLVCKTCLSPRLEVAYQFVGMLWIRTLEHQFLNG